MIKLLNICDNYGQANSIYFNPSKSAYIVFAPSFEVKYLGFRLNHNVWG